MKKKNIAILLALSSTIFTSTGQILFKKTSAIVSLNPVSFLNLFFLLSLISYGLGSIFLVFAFKKGELSLTYPLLALSYVWVNIGAVYFFNETLTFFGIFGTG